MSQSIALTRLSGHTTQVDVWLTGWASAVSYANQTFQDAITATRLCGANRSDIVPAPVQSVYAHMPVLDGLRR
jgi:hypothetical protein